MSLILTADAASTSDSIRRDCGRGAFVLCVVLVLAGAALRCHGVATISINGDEIYSVWETRSARKAADATDAWPALVNRVRLMVSSEPFEVPGIGPQETWRLRWGY